MRRRLVLLAVASTSLVAIAFLVPLFLLVEQLAVDRATRPAELAARSIAPVAALADEATLRDVLVASGTGVGGTASVVLPDDRVVGAPLEVDTAVRAARSDRRATALDTPTGRRFLVPVVADRGVLVVDVRVPVDRSGVRLAQGVLAVLGVVLVAGATLLSDRVARRTVEAARRLETTALALSDGDLERRARVEEPPGLAAVGRALDVLAGRITALLAEQREEAADLSHGLRTPLTALRLDVEALPATAGRERLLGDLAALDRAVVEVIAAARAPVRAGVGTGCDPVAVVEERAAFWRPLAADEGRAFELTLPAGARPRVTIAARDLATALDVLLDNAFRHTPAGAAIGLRVAVAAEVVEVEVADDGPGLPAGADVLHRGWTGGDGSGLGLDIARRLAAAAGGSLAVVAERSPPASRGRRSGAVLVLRLPRGPDGAA